MDIIVLQKYPVVVVWEQWLRKHRLTDFIRVPKTLRGGGANWITGGIVQAAAFLSLPPLLLHASVTFTLNSIKNNDPWLKVVIDIFQWEKIFSFA